MSYAIGVQWTYLEVANNIGNLRYFRAERLVYLSHHLIIKGKTKKCSAHMQKHVLLVLNPIHRIYYFIIRIDRLAIYTLLSRAWSSRFKPGSFVNSIITYLIIHDDWSLQKSKTQRTTHIPRNASSLTFQSWRGTRHIWWVRAQPHLEKIHERRSERGRELKNNTYNHSISMWGCGPYLKDPY